jgi:hypothetical protein
MCSGKTAQCVQINEKMKNIIAAIIKQIKQQHRSMR